MLLLRRFLLLFALTAGAFPLSAAAHDYRLGDLAISHPWGRPSPPSVETAAGYLGIGNGGAQSDALIAAESPVSRRVELHTHLMEGDIMRMRRVERIDIPAGANVALEPGGLHLMFIGIDAPFILGTQVPVTLIFERAGRIEIELAVERSPAPAHGH